VQADRRFPRVHRVVFELVCWIDRFHLDVFVLGLHRLLSISILDPTCLINSSRKSGSNLKRDGAITHDP
jgi:hypothetical protein